MAKNQNLWIIDTMTHWLSHAKAPYFNELLPPYYINMAEAWLVCEMYIKFPIETLGFIKDNKMNTFTHNKSISKIRDSYRVSKDEKEFLNTLKK